MKELHDLQTLQLKNLMASETITYYKLAGYGASAEECTPCNTRIKQIEIKLHTRRNAGRKKFVPAAKCICSL